jgi:hypothetical protein
MTQTFSPSEAAFSVFELAKRQPQFVLRYCIIYALFMMASYALAGASGFGQFMSNYVALAGTGTPDPEAVLDLFATGGVGLGIMAVYFFVTRVLTSAMALRKAVRDEDSGLFGLKFGADELALSISTFCIWAILFGVYLLVTIVGAAVTMGTPALLILVITASLITTVFVGIRLSQFGVITIAQSQAAVVQSWKETKGHASRFLGAHLLWILVSGILVLIASVVATTGAGAMGTQVGSSMPVTLAAFMTPGWWFYALLFGLVSGFANLGSVCIGAYAWHQMRGDIPAAKTSV